MSKPFDVTLKHMLEDHPADCARLAGVQTAAPITVIDGDVSTVSAMADKVLRIEESQPWLLHFEFQTSYEADLPQRVLQYNVLLNSRHAVPVQSAVVLLRREADGPEMTGVLRKSLRNGRLYLEFHYDAIRIWQTPVEQFLQGGLGTLPLAPIAATGEAEAIAVVQRMKQRLTAELSQSEAGIIWAQTDVLLGLRFSKLFADQLLRGVHGMKDSVTYQAIVEEGVLAEAQRFVLLLGTKHLGPPDAATKEAIAAITDPGRLEQLGQRASDVKSWQELLAEPRPKRRNGRKRKS